MIIDNEKRISESLKLMRAADLVGSLLKTNAEEFEYLRRTTTYKNNAYEHHLNGMSIVYYDAAMYMRYLLEVVNRKCKENREYFKLQDSDPDDQCFEMVAEILEACIDLALSTTSYDGKATNYLTVTEQYLKPIKENWHLLSEKIWHDAESNKTPSDNSYHNLANAILALAARDYESALSGVSREPGITAECGVKMGKKFASGQAKNYSSVDLEAVFQKIDKNYKELEKIVSGSAVDIVKEWKRLEKSGYVNETKRSDFMFRCPNCGDALRPLAPDKIMNVPRIGCCGCNLFVPISDGDLKKIGSVSIKKKHGGNKSKGSANDAG